MASHAAVAPTPHLFATCTRPVLIFELAPSTSRQSAALMSVVAGGGGTLLGGLAVKRLGLKVRGLLKMTSVTQFIAIITAIGLVARCPPIETIGPQRNISSLGPGLECNCDCDKFDYSPVCSDSGDALLQFYNPCYAGCQDKHLEPGSGLLYLNCSCIPLPVSLPLPAPVYLIQEVIPHVIVRE